MNKEQKQEVIETLKNKFSQYSNFYITDTQNLSVAQITNLRRHCFDKQVEMKVAKNTLIKKALESLDNDRYSGVYDSLHQVTALMFSDSPKEPALIISSFRKSLNGEKPLLKAAFLNGDIFVGDNQLVNLTKIKTKNELIGEVIGLLMSPIQRVIGALQNRSETTGAEAKVETAPAAEPVKPEAKAEVAESKAISTEAKSDPQPAAKAEVAPAPEAAKPEAKAEVPEPKAAATEIKTEAVAPSPEVVKPEAKAEVAEPKAVVTEAKSETQPLTEVKAEVVEPSSKVKPEAKVEAAEPKAVATEDVAPAAPIVSEAATESEPAADVAKPEAKEDKAEPEA